MRKCLYCQQSGEPLYLCFGCDLFMKEHSEKKTNADRIRAMSDEELLDFICSIETYDEGSAKTIEGGSALCSVADIENWLQSGVEE